MNRLAYVAVEGIDGTGKSSLCLNVGKEFEARQIRTRVFHDPDDTELGRFVRRLWREGASEYETAMQMLFAASSTQLSERIQKLADEQDVQIVIGDRCALSNYAYCATDDLDWIEVLHSHYVFPDFTFFIDVSPEEAMRRLVLDGRSHETTLERLRAVRISYRRSIAYWIDRGRKIELIESADNLSKAEVLALLTNRINGEIELG